MREEISILFSADKGYARYCAVTIYTGEESLEESVAKVIEKFDVFYTNVAASSACL